MLLALVFYGVLVSIAIWSTAREPDLRWIGASVGASYAFSNMVWFTGTVYQRPGIYSMLEIFIILATYIAWEVRQERILFLIVFVSALSICANIALALIDHPARGQVRMHEIITNICFGAECLLLIFVGVRDGFRTGRFRRLPFGRVSRPSPHGAGRIEDA